jgi:hypothetical protein
VRSSGWDQLVGFCEHGNELSGSIKGGTKKIQREITRCERSQENCSRPADQPCTRKNLQQAVS